jgi:hypothetical protein
MSFTLTIQADSISALRGKLSAYLAEISPQVIIGTNHEAGIIVPETKPRATRAKAPVSCGGNPTNLRLDPARGYFRGYCGAC